MWIGANDDQISLPGGQQSDFEPYSNRLQLDLILILVNFSCELGQIMTRYDFQESLRMILRKCLNQLQLDLISLLVNLLDEFGQIMARYDFLEALRVILSNVQTDSNLTWFN